MSALRRRVAEVTGAAEASLERLSGGDLSEVLLVRRPDGSTAVARGGLVSVEAAMLRVIAEAGVPAPTVEGEYEGVLLLEHIQHDGLLTPRAWANIGAQLRRLHARSDEHYGWPVDFAIGPVEISNRQTADWRRFWIEERLLHAAATLDRPWRERLMKLLPRIEAVLPVAPRPALLHGDLWTGNILVKEGQLAALIDPCCYYGDVEVDLAMLTLFDDPPPDFQEAYGPLDAAWQARRPVYQLFPALLHMRLFGTSYAGLVDRLMASLETKAGSSA
jgi:fructosamine-3-kinase